MSAETQLYAALLAVPAITALVGSGSAARIYPVTIPDLQSVPAIAYQRTGTEYANTIGETGVAAKATFDVFCIAKEYGPTEALCDLIEAMEYEKVARSSTYDLDSELFASIITINVWQT